MSALRNAGRAAKIRLHIPIRQNACCCVALVPNHKNSDVHNLNTRHFSLQPVVESFSRTQAGIFKSLSESVPVEYLHNLLINVHDTTGLPWWATIVCTTILLRSCVTVPLALYQNYILAKVENISLEMPAIAKELQKETAMAIKLYKWDERTAKIQYKKSLKQQWNKLVVRDNCHPFKASVLLWFQIPMWISLSVSLRNFVYMLPRGDLDAQLRFTEFTLGGFGWIPNLTEADASYILPLALGVLNLTIIEIQALSKARTPSKFQQYVTNFFRVLSFGMVPLAAWVPSCLALYWTTSSAYGLVQNLVLLSPKVKRAFKIPECPSELKNPYLHVWSGLKLRFDDVTNILKIKRLMVGSTASSTTNYIRGLSAATRS